MHLRILNLSLSRRIVVSVGFGLGLVLSLASLLSVWTIHDSTAAAYQERVRLAQHFAQRVDDSLQYTLALLTDQVTGIRLEPGNQLAPDQQRLLSDLQPLRGQFTALTITDGEGEIRWLDTSRPWVMHPLPAVHPSVQLALRTGEPQIAPCSASDGTDPKRVCLVVPLHGITTTATGVLLAGFQLDTALFNPVDVGQDSPLRVDLVQTPEDVGTATLSSPSGHLALLAPLMAERTAGYRTHDPQGGHKHIVAYAPVSRIPSWGITVEEPTDTVLALPTQLKRRLAAFGVAMLILAMVVAWFDVLQVVRPLGQITMAAERFARGEFEQPIHLDRDDELGTLARAFESMRRRLRSSLAEIEGWNHELEQRVVARTAEVEARNRQLAHLNTIAETVSGSLDQRTMLRETLVRILGITGADAGCFTVLNDEAILRVVAGQPATLERSGEQIFPGLDLCWQAVQTNQIVEGQSATLRELMPSLASWLALPLSAREQVQGVLLLGAVQPDHFTHQSLATLLAIGQHIGLALANVKLYERLAVREHERAALLQQIMHAQEDERRRLAQELHDETSQALASLQLGLERLSELETDVPASVRQLAQDLRAIATATLAEVHRLAVELRPSVLDDHGLVAALERYLNDCATRGGLQADFASVGLAHLCLMPAAQTAIYRIVQGALTNVVQHAEAKHVSVLLERRRETLIVVVEDDGQGFDLSAVRASALEGRLGVAGMEERASLLGGKLTIETAPGQGTAVFLEVPLSLNGQEEGADVGAAPVAR